MADQQEKGPVIVVSACMRSDGLPDFAITTVEVTPDEYDNGVHYDLAAAALIQRGFDEPFVHFSELEMPPFLLSAVRAYLGLNTADAASPTIV